MKTSGMVLLALTLGCGASAETSSASPAEETSGDEAIAESGGPALVELPELEVGSCGGMAELELAEPVALLQERLWISPLAGQESSVRVANIMAAPPNADRETRLLLVTEEDERHVVFSVEMFGRAGESLVDTVAHGFPTGHTFHRLDIDGLEGVIALPRELDTSRDAVALAHVMTVLDERMLQLTSIFVTPRAAESGGCQALALRQLRSLRRGERALSLRNGSQELGDGLWLEVPRGYHLSTDTGPEFLVFHVNEITELGPTRGAHLGIYIGGHPSPPTPDGASELAGRLFDEEVSWLRREVDGGHRQDLLIEHPGAAGLFLHVFMSAGTTRELDALQRIAEGLALEELLTAPEPPAPPTAPIPVDP